MKSMTKACCHCGERFDSEAMVSFADGWVCEGCKPKYVQKLKEGIPSAPPPKKERKKREFRPGFIVTSGLAAIAAQVALTAGTIGYLMTMARRWDEIAMVILGSFFGTAMTAVPIGLCAVMATYIARKVVSGQRHRALTYVFAVVATVVSFFLVISFDDQPIPDIIFGDNEYPASIARPLIRGDEVPLLVISVLAGLFGAWVADFCSRRGTLNTGHTSR